MSNEFKYRIGSNSNIIGRPPTFYGSANLLSSGCQFASVYAVRVDDAYALQEVSKSVEGFKGIVWSQRLWVDFDNEQPAKEAQRYLKEQGYDHVVYTTGNRGCHIGILRNAHPSHTLPAQDKAWVKEHLQGADLSLYWHLHLIRLPGAIHEKTGLPKKLLYREEGKALTLPDYIPKQTQESIPTGEAASIEGPGAFTLWSVVSRLTGKAEQGGGRSRLVLLALALIGQAKLDKLDTFTIMWEVNKGLAVPKDKSDIERIIEWAYEETNQRP